MIRIINNLPEDIPTSPDLTKNAKAWFEFTLYGKYYYVPLTKEFQKLLKIKKINGEYKMPTFKSSTQLRLALVDMTSGIYLQIRNTVGSEIHRQLSTQIKNDFEELFSDKLENAIINGFQKKLPLIEGETNDHHK